MANETILIVEDDAIIAVQLQDMLTGLGYTALGPVDSGEAALAAVKVQPPDLVLMDIKLAGALDGIVAARRIQSAADIPIVFLTGYSQDLMFQQAKVTAPYGFLVKPVRERELAVTLEMALYRHTLDRRLRESEEKYRRLVDNANEAILVAQDGQLKFVNPMVIDLTGYSEQELTSRPFPEFIHPDDRGMVVERHLMRLEGDVSLPRYAFRLMTRDGSVKWVEIAAILIDWEGRPATLNFLSDITERKRAESQREAALEALRRTEENFRRSLDDSPLGVRIVTAAGKTIYANRELLDFYNYDSVEELNKIPLQERYTPQSYAGFKLRREAREQGNFGPSEYKIAIVRKNGEILQLQVFRKEVFWNGEKQFQALYRDITEEKKRGEALRQFEATIQGQKTLLDQQSSSVEEFIERLTLSKADLEISYETLKVKKDDLVRSEKLAFAGRMAVGIAHEIRNPLTNIILSLRQLKKDEKIKPEGLKYAEIVENNTNRIEYLIAELLNCARPVKLDLQLGDIHLLIKDILNVHRIRLKTQRIKVINDLIAHPSVLLFDEEQLGRVLLNLIANAIEAMRKGGNLSIVTKKEKSNFIIKIQDDGRGIPEKNLIKVFDPFFSTKKRGAGLGLSTCQNIVTSHGGLIEVESAWRKGSIFSVSLPLEPKQPDGKETLKATRKRGRSL